MPQLSAPHESASALHHLRAAWDFHDRAATRKDSLLRRIRADEPRLAGRAARLRDEHDHLVARLHHLIRSATPGGEAGERLTAELIAMQAAIRDHERRVSDLLYEAYFVDLGTAG